MKQKLRSYFNFSFLIFLLVAALLWYGNKLGGRYTTEVMLPVRIQNDFSSRMWVEKPLIQVHARVEGVGTSLMAYKVNVGERMTIPMSQLNLTPVAGEERTFRIDKGSLVGALSAEMKDLRVHQVLDSVIVIRVSPVESRKMAVESRIEVEPARQYMEIGMPLLTPDSVEVRGPKSILDSMQVVSTRTKHYSSLKMSVAGNIDLVQPEGVLLSNRQVDYRIEVVPFTQQTLELPVRIVNMPEGWESMTVPAKVTVTLNVPLRDIERVRGGRIFATVDYAQLRLDGGGKSPVRIDSLPGGTEIIQVDPQFVEPFFIKQ